MYFFSRRSKVFNFMKHGADGDAFPTWADHNGGGGGARSGVPEKTVAIPSLASQPASWRPEKKEPPRLPARMERLEAERSDRSERADDEDRPKPKGSWRKTVARVTPDDDDAPARSRRRAGSRERGPWLKRGLVALVLALAGTALAIGVPRPQWVALATGAQGIWQTAVTAVTTRIEGWRKGKDAPPVATARAPETPPAVAPGKPVAKPVPPRRQRGVVGLSSSPPGATVIGPRGIIGTTPLAYGLKPGRVEVVTFTLDGYQPLSRRIKGGRQGTPTVMVEMVPRQPAPAPVVPAAK